MSRPLTQAEYDRARQRYARMVGRSVAVRFDVLGPVVEAGDPGQLEAATNAVLATATRKQLPS